MDYGVRVERIRERMRALGIGSARQLAALSGVDNVTVSKLLADNRPQVSVVTVARLAAALKCSVDYLLGMIDDASGTGIVMPAGGEEMLRALETLPLARRAELLDIAAVMAASEEGRRERLEEFERLAELLQSRMPAAEYHALMNELFRALRANDRAALDALIARYGPAQPEAHERAQKT